MSAMTRDDDRLAQASRALRRRQHLRQIDLKSTTRSREFVMALEGGRAAGLRLGDLRRHFTALGASLRVTVWWEGAALDRLLDERHAQVVEGATRELQHFRWPLVAAEVSFSEYGERGSIDVFGGHPDAGAVFVGEAKSEWGSVEETLRRLNIKTRLAPKIGRDTFGFRVRHVAAVLIFPDESTHRRVAERFPATVDAALPARGREIRRWLRQPSGDLRGLWFLSNVGSPPSGDAVGSRKAPE